MVERLMLLDKKKTTLILGAYGRIGLPLVDLMDKEDYYILYPTRLACNLLDNYSLEQYFRNYKPSYVINLTGKTTNIGLCNDFPATICRETLLMNVNLLDICKKYKVEKLINIVCSCSY